MSQKQIKNVRDRNERPWNVFISYSHTDKDAARRLAEALRSNGLNVWFDKWELKPGDHWQEKIENAIKSSEAALILVSPSAESTGWASKEWSLILEKIWDSPDTPIIPILIEDAKIPPFISDRHSMTIGRSPSEINRVAQIVSEILMDQDNSLVGGQNPATKNPNERKERYAALREAIQTAIADDDDMHES